MSVACVWRGLLKLGFDGGWLFRVRLRDAQVAYERCQADLPEQESRLSLDVLLPRMPEPFASLLSRRGAVPLCNTCRSSSAAALRAPEWQPARGAAAVACCRPDGGAGSVASSDGPPPSLVSQSASSAPPAPRWESAVESEPESASESEPESSPSSSVASVQLS